MNVDSSSRAVSLRRSEAVLDVRRMTARIGAPAIVGLAVAAICLIRQLPVELQYEEPTEFWARAPTLDAWAGYLQLWARLVFAIARPFDDLGPFITRVAAAGLVGMLAWYFASENLAHAIPNWAVRIAFALSLAMLPIPNPGPYLGPLNSQWWMAIGVTGIALAEPRRWHYAALVVAGFSGIAPCLALPVLSDRRFVALLIPAIIQSLLVLSDRSRTGADPAIEYLLVALTVAVVVLVARLPFRTRLAFMYMGIATLAVAAYATGWFENQYRYLAIPGAAISLGLASWLRHA